MKKCLTILNLVSAIVLVVIGLFASIGEWIGGGNLFEELEKIGISRSGYCIFFVISLAIFLITNFIGSKFYREK